MEGEKRKKASIAALPFLVLYTALSLEKEEKGGGGIKNLNTLTCWKEREKEEAR